MGWASMAQRMLGVSIRTFSEPAAALDPLGAVYWLTDGIEPGVPLAQAVFDTAHVSVDPETGAPVSTNNPILGVRLIDLPNNPTNRDRVRARGVLYMINEPQFDGVAGVTITLRKV
ncbi:electron transfer flavoprotein [Pseudomonas veronii]|uniref:Electron transfer flavoprotein n=1 Tax=Pseudomonas veronii TaxID=76761 RepID=A0A7Y1A1T8_PSEVE|nr:electron transfer flavoprotein [Pseudomonas veronii]NMY07585.1 electron transfer flavoprotein [Pseudomonas veronii]